jgi:hypothetical protein
MAMPPQPLEQRGGTGAMIGPGAFDQRDRPRQRPALTGQNRLQQGVTRKIGVVHELCPLQRAFANFTGLLVDAPRDTCLV